MRLALLFVAVFLCVSCVPASVEYFRPEASGGKAIEKICGTSVAPKNTWQYEIGGVTLETTVGENREKRRAGLTLRLFVPIGTTLSLQSKDVSVRTTARLESRKIEMMRLILYKGTFNKETKRLESTELKAHAQSEWVQSGREIFLLTAEMEPPLESEFFVAFPLIAVDGKLFEIPEIKFTKQRGIGLYAINC